MEFEKGGAIGSSEATVGRSTAFAEKAGAQGVYTVKCLDSEGNLKWEDTADNVVTLAGKNLALDTFLAGSAYTITGPYLGLIGNTTWVNLATTISSLTTYTGSVVTLVTAAAHGLTQGDTFTIASATGTGANVSSVQGTWVAAAGTTGTTLVFNIYVSGLTITTLTGGSVTTTSATRIADTLTSHANWVECGATNAPAYTAPRKTVGWALATSGIKASNSITAFVMTSAGTVNGCFLVYGTGALSTIDNTAGTLYSAGAFTGGAKIVAASDQLQVSYSAAL